MRLEGIDAPESHQAFGIQSKKHLSNMVFGREGTVVYRKRINTVREIILDGTDIDLEQIRLH
ncbi:MAG: hypothetical protein DMF74_20660 [Acidobacteria bacterium]|nr:MAG: hypothetical protein DMF74_20660 [Acidobacteriota bacterium]